MSKLNPDDSVNKISGVGEKKAARLNALGISDVNDLISYYPYKYKDRKKEYKVKDAVEHKDVLVSGVLMRKQQRSYGRGKSLVECTMCDDNDTFSVVFFSMPYIYNTLQIGHRYSVFGKVSRKYGKAIWTNPDICEYGCEKDIREYVPVYHCTHGISNNDLYRFIKYSIDNCDIADWINKDILIEDNLCSRQYSIRNIHFPESNRAYKFAKARLVYDELLKYQIAVRRNRAQFDSNSDAGLEVGNYSIFVDSLPFKLTQGQEKTIEEIRMDIISPRPMNRLIQGDVGCGKTVVAETAIFMAVTAGTQAAMMAPTEILARQHFRRLKQDYYKHDINVGLLTSGMSKAARKDLLENLIKGNIDVLVGTHALIQDDVLFNNLGLVVTDEQHRFGVNQRKSLVRKGEAVNVIVMSATPIPRTLAATVYGDMDFSIINTKPADRLPIITRSLTEVNREIAYSAAREELSRGHKVYVVAPSIDDDNTDIESVESLYNEMRNKFTECSIGCIHGRMDKDKKESIMNRFVDGSIQMLVSTVVIEVGIDIPDASTIIIENGERFGLAQLHQLRGRVGRSDIQSYCYIINYSKSEAAIERTRLMSEISDGFILSEEDFRLRGPGDIIGTMQHGSCSNNILSLCSHKELLDMAIKDADRIIKDNYRDIDISVVNRSIDKMYNTDNSDII